MKKNLLKMLLFLFCFIGCTNANAQPQKLIITILHASTKSDSEAELSYSADSMAKLIFAQAKFQ